MEVSQLARKSKYVTEFNKAEKKKKVKWQAALYVRISREDGDKEESDSISNQRTLLRDYISCESDIDIYGIYIDDGWSGTNFDRPDFLRMMEDIKSRSVNCVVVKDLSRFGRNYIEVGNYIEKVFPFMDVRFISINDTLDSFKNPQSMNNLIVPFKNIINDEYCRDISNKVRSSLDLKRKQGKFIGSFATFGYLKDPDDRNKLIVDEYASAIVRDIFSWFIEGMGCITIAKRLNDQGVLNSTAYKQSLGFNYRHPTGEKNDKLWCSSSVRRILINRMYIGTLVQGKNKVKSYKVQVSVQQPEDKWIEIENSHEAIIDRETFDKVQNLLKRDTRTPPKKKHVYLFAGFLRCADCRKAMNRKLISQPYGEYHYYVCSTFKKMSKEICSKHTIRSDRLEEAVFTTIRQHINFAVSIDEVIVEINERGKAKTDSRRLAKALSEKEAEKRKLENMKLALYPDWKNGDISKEEYQSLKEQFDTQLLYIEETIKNINREIGEYEKGVDNNNAFIANFSKYTGIEKLTREMLIELVEYIYVHEGGGITIQFKFSDEFEQAVEFMENNKEMTESA